MLKYFHLKAALHFYRTWIYNGKTTKRKKRHLDTLCHSKKSFRCVPEEYRFLEIILIKKRIVFLKNKERTWKSEWQDTFAVQMILKYFIFSTSRGDYVFSEPVLWRIFLICGRLFRLLLKLAGASQVILDLCMSYSWGENSLCLKRP